LEYNYASKAAGWLPPVRISGLERPPVLQIINEITGEIIYTLRIKSFEYQARVFENGTYTIVLGEPGTSSMKNIPGLNSQESREQVPIEISFQ
jgi:alkaline phosphatase D